MPSKHRSDTVTRVSILETVAIYVGGPAVIYGGIAALTLIPGRAKRRARYSAGQAWNMTPQWWAGDNPVVASDAVGGTAQGGAHGTW